MITIKRARRVVDLVTDLSLAEEYTAALRALDEARGTMPAVAMEVGESPAVHAAAETVVALEQQMAATTLHFTIEAVTRLRWAEFVAAHPPREGVDMDRAQGFDVSSLDEIIPESIKAVHDADGKPVDFAPKTEWPALSAELADGQWSEFAAAIVTVNGASEAPKSRAASLAMRSSDKS